MSEEEFIYHETTVFYMEKGYTREEAEKKAREETKANNLLIG